MESQVISCNQGDVPGYYTLESYILLLIQVPNKKQSRNLWGFQFIKHTFFGGDFFLLVSCDSLLEYQRSE